MQVDELSVLITANAEQFKKELDKMTDALENVKKTTQKSTSGITKAFSALKKGAAALAIGAVLKKSISTAIESIESENLFAVTMGRFTQDASKWADQVSEALGLSATTIRKNTGVIYNMTTAMGLAKDTALSMSKGVTLLAEDMASFYNIDSTTAFSKIQSGLTGMGVGLKELGILIDEDTIKQVAYTKGIAKEGEELTNQQKVFARYLAIMEQTKTAHGDLARTLNSPANLVRRLKNELMNCANTIGTIFMPVVSKVLVYVNALAKVLSNALKSVASFLGVTGSSLSDTTADASSNVSALAGDMEDADDSAKSIKKSLSGFDEIENLNVPEIAPIETVDTEFNGFKLEGYDAGLSNIEDKTKEVVNKINKIFAGFHIPHIDLTPLTDSLGRLWDALKPFGQGIWDGLKWGIENVLAPLAELTIEDVIPKGLDMISSVLNSITGGGSTEEENITSQKPSVGEAPTAIDVPVRISTDLSTLFDDIQAPDPIMIDVNTDAMTAARNAIIADFDAISIDAGTLGTTLSSIWDTNPLQIFIATVKDLGIAIGGLVTTLGRSAWTNISGTWSKIEKNVSGSIANITKLWTLFWFDTDKTITKWSPKITASVNKVFNSIWSDAIGPAVTIAAGIWEDFTKSLAKFWEEWGAPVVDKIGEAINGVVDTFNTTWTNIVKPILDVLFSELKDFWENHGKPMVDKVLNFIGKLADGVLELFNKAFLPAYKWLVEKLSPILNWLAESVAKQFSAKWAIIVDTIGNVADALSGLVDFIVGVFTGDWDKAWKGLSDSLDAIFNGVVDIFKGAINLIITGINTFIKAINKIKIDIPEWVPVIGGGSFGFNIKELPKLARGGIVSSPTIAMIGEAGKEAVVPLENNTGWIDKLASKIAVMLAAMRANEDNRPINVNVTTELNGKVVSKELIRDLNKEARRLGYKPLLAT